MIFKNKLLLILIIIFSNMAFAHAQKSKSPRFVSLKADKVNVREGPSQEHQIAWVFKRAGLTIEVIAEVENWLKIRDSSGAEGWVFHRLVSNRRTALIIPWAQSGQTVSMYREASTDSGLVARLEPNVLVSPENCNGKWCKVVLSQLSGWIEQKKLWGIYQNETFEN